VTHSAESDEGRNTLLHVLALAVRGDSRPKVRIDRHSAPLKDFSGFPAVLECSCYVVGISRPVLAVAQ
jgi:hypothetical protein